MYIREVWPEEGIFGTSEITTDEELTMLQTVYNADLGVEPTGQLYQHFFGNIVILVLFEWQCLFTNTGDTHTANTLMFFDKIHKTT